MTEHFGRCDACERVGWLATVTAYGLDTDACRRCRSGGTQW